MEDEERFVGKFVQVFVEFVVEFVEVFFEGFQVGLVVFGVGWVDLGQVFGYLCGDGVGVGW